MTNRKDGGAANVPTLMPDYLTLRHHSGTFYTSLDSDVSPVGKPNGGERYIKKKTAKLEAHILLDALFSVARGECPDAEICEVIEEIADDYEYPPSDWSVIYNCASLRQHQQDGGWLPIDEWHEDMGPAFWTAFPVEEPYYAGSPLDCDWPGYHTHFIPMSVFNHLIDDRGNMKTPAPKKENDDGR